MKTAPPSVHPQETRDLLLTAAGPIFARQGFHATSVREITRAAGVNIAAINYHFRDKQEFYAQTLICAHQAAVKTAGFAETGTPEEKLKSFIYSFLTHLLDPKRPAWHGQLIAREMAQPTAALDLLVEQSIKPLGERILKIIHELMGKGVPLDRARRTCFSVIGQCLYYVHCREMIIRIFPAERGTPHDIAALADHIFQFSLAGIRALSSPAKPKSPRNKPK